MSTKAFEFKSPDRTKMDAFVETGTVRPQPGASEPVRKVVATRQLTVEIPEDLHSDLKMECVRLGAKNYEVVRKALSEALEKLKGMDRDQKLAWLSSV